MLRKITVITVVFALCFSFMGCASMQVNERKLTEKEAKQETHVFMARLIGMFAGMVIGGMGGLVTAEQNQGVTSALLGALIGSAIGFGVGHLVGENTKNIEEKPDDEKLKQYYKEYQWMKER